MVQYSSSAETDFNSLYSAEYNNASKAPFVKVTYTLTSEIESNNTAATANEMDVHPVPGTVSSINGVSNSDYDYFKIVAPRHGRVRVSLAAYGASASHWVHVYDQSNTLLTSKKTSALLNSDENSYTATTTFVTLKDGDLNSTLDTYYIRVSNTGTNGKSYRLTLQYVTDYAELDWAYPLSTTYAHINSPVSGRNYNGWAYHNGLDIQVVDQTIYAVTDAKVVKRGFGHTSMGNYVAIQTSSSGDTDFATGKTFVIVYMHLSSISVELNQNVSKGQAIGVSGSSGNVAAHLHFEVYVYDDTVPTYVTAHDASAIINPYELYYDRINFTGVPY